MLPLTTTQAEALADLLAADARSDTHVAAAETARVMALLENILGTEGAAALRERVERFDGAAFSVANAAAAFAGEDDERRQAVLDAVFAVVAADRFIDSSELGFVAEVAGALALAMPDY